MSSNKLAIKVENISKRYRIGVKENIHDSFGSAMFEFIKSPLSNYRKYRSLYKFDNIASDQTDGQTNDDPTVIWALKNVSFEVMRGEVVGIIGKNGAGKSTLLKTLCKITDPTSGEAKIRGRISSLLEVGTGFHQELTGRENVYLNGTILGMRKKEIDFKFDEIVEFSGVEKFLDTPVKRYSSGMRVRLAFAVAAHLEPEILLIDEVLAVGDADFQKKCLNKMEDIGGEGRTVLFVSHNMSAITRLCQRTILLDGGSIVADGPSSTVVTSYYNSGTGSSAVREWPDLTKAPGNDRARLRSVKVLNEERQVSETVDIRQPVGLQMEFEVLKPGYIMLPYYILYNEEGVRVFTAVDLDPDWRGRPRLLGRYISVAWVPDNLFSEGRMFVAVALKTTAQKIETYYFRETEVVAFQVIDSLDGDSARGDYAGKMGGAIRPLLRWETKFFPNRQRSVSTTLE